MLSRIADFVFNLNFFVYFYHLLFRKLYSFKAGSYTNWNFENLNDIILHLYLSVFQTLFSCVPCYLMLVFLIALSGGKWYCNIQSNVEFYFILFPGWHTCMVCHKASQIQCYCCPNATCWDCTHIAELVNIKGKYGFCSFCLKLALLVEDHRDADSDGVWIMWTYSCDYQT